MVFHSHDFLLASLSLDIFVPCQQNPSCVLQTLHKSLSCTTKTCTKYFPVPLRITKLAQRCTKYFPVLLRITKLAQSTSQYYFVLQSLHKDLHSLPCKSRKNCVELPSNDKHGCSHSSATCEPGSPNTMAQHSQSSHEPSSNQLYSGERVRDETREDRPCRKNQVPHIAAGKHFMQERQGFVRFLSFKHHLDEAFPLRAAIASLQITIELLQQEQQSKRQSSHSKANCKPGSPNTMAQRTQSSPQPLQNQLSSRRPPPERTLCEKT